MSEVRRQVKGGVIMKTPWAGDRVGYIRSCLYGICFNPVMSSDVSGICSDLGPNSELQQTI